MRWMDVLAMGINNLRRRKLRTALTVLGVTVGTAAIVVMLSLGIGLKEMNRELVESSGSITTIVVQGDMYMRPGSKEEPKYLTDEVMKKFGRMKHVKGVYPFLDTSVIMKQGVYQADTTIRGVSREYMAQIPIKKGTAFKGDPKELNLIYGDRVINDFFNQKSGRFSYETEEPPKVDFIKKPVFVVFDSDAYYQTQGDSNKKPPKKYVLKTSGIVDGGPENISKYSYYVYTDLELLKAQLKRVFKKNPIPGQPTNKKGKAYPYFIYDSVEVNVDDIKNVESVQKQIIESGYQADSNIEWMKQSEQQSGMIQSVLGGIGAVSLFVASIGIANTMMMSVYERTKEIGVLKVLGCDIGTIRNVFLVEAGFIGLFGGIAGTAISYLSSGVLNTVLKNSLLINGGQGDISRIPIELTLLAIAFSIIIGMAAGLFPALRAMKLSPLAAIRNN